MDQQSAIVQAAHGGGQAAPETPKIELRGVAKSFGANHVLRGVDLSVARGESLAIIGGSGTGKSVAIKCVLGLLEPNAGEILIDGVRVDRRRRDDALLARFGMLFQGAALFDSLPVWRNVAFRLLQRKDLSRAECRAVAIEKLRRVGMSEKVADLFPAELSGGMQKRVGLARAIAADPEVIFFDEPTTGLDPIMAGVINELIRELVDEIGATAVTITHDMSSVRAIAHRVAMLYDGEIRWHGRVMDMDFSGDPYMQQFISGSAIGPIDTLR
ncbi:MAG: ATP-binding cassette domain-containing protein [Neomegalonema sp.]|nr:ATP-binding cassette domain-containing protein [Neomegalonema sp.]